MTTLQDEVYAYIQRREQEMHGPVPTLQIHDRYFDAYYFALKQLEQDGRVVLGHDRYGWSHYSTVIGAYRLTPNDYATRDEVRSVTDRWAIHDRDEQAWRIERDATIVRCYAGRNATLAELATDTGLSKQRIHQIVGGR